LFQRETSVVDNGKPFDIVFLDLAKAFDKVPRDSFLEKLRAHDERGMALAWIALVNEQETEICPKWVTLQLVRSLVSHSTENCGGAYPVQSFHQ
jgi:protein-L-isoaspartate O-methyltransferase